MTKFHFNIIFFSSRLKTISIIKKNEDLGNFKNKKPAATTYRRKETASLNAFYGPTSTTAKHKGATHKLFIVILTYNVMVSGWGLGGVGGGLCVQIYRMVFNVARSKHMLFAAKLGLSFAGVPREVCAVTAK